MCIQTTTPPYHNKITSSKSTFFYFFYFFILILIINHGIIPTTVQAQKNGQNQNTLTINNTLLPTITLNRVSPSLDWFLDPSGQLTIEQILSPTIQRAFSSFLFTKIPKQSGTFWFRFTLDSTTRIKLPELILDLNKRIPEQFPGQPKVWVSSMGSEKANRLTPLSKNVFSIKYSGSEIIDVYIQMAGAPGFGFNPIVLSSKKFLNIYDITTKATYFLLITSIIICIARGIKEKQEWRIWSTLYIGAIFISILWGLPQTPKGILTILDIPGLLSPGIALFTLAHIGRRLLQTRYYSSILDTQLLLLGFPGIILSLIPLLPGYLWFLPYISIWPLVTIMLLPTTIFAMTQKFTNAKTFLFICLPLPLSLLPIAIPISFIPQSISPELVNIIPLLLMSTSCLVLTLSKSPKPIFISTKNKVSPYFDKALTTFQSEMICNTELAKNHESSIFEQKIQVSLNRILKELANLNLSLQPTYLKQHIENIESTTEYLNHVINDAPELFMLNNSPTEETFDLTQLVLSVHNAVEKEAEEKNLALSWFIAPHLSKKYKGNRLQLTQSLYLLVENAVQTTQKGVIQLRVQRYAESTDPGHLLVSVSISGEWRPHINRSSLALSHAWELVHATGGTLNIKSEPTETDFSFSVKLIAIQTEGSLTNIQEQKDISSNQIQRVIIADSTSQQRQLLTYYLDGLPYECIESNEPYSINETYKNALASLLIFGSDMPENDIIEVVGSIRVFEGEHNFPPIPILALCKTDSQAEKLIRIGCTHTLLEPISRKEFRYLVLRLAPISQRIQSIFNTNNIPNKNKKTFPHVASALYKTKHNYKAKQQNNELQEKILVNNEIDEDKQKISTESISINNSGLQPTIFNASQESKKTEKTQELLEGLSESNLQKISNEPLNKTKKHSPSIEYPPLEEPLLPYNQNIDEQKHTEALKNHTQETKITKKKQTTVTTHPTNKNKKAIQKNKSSLPLLDIINIDSAEIEDASKIINTSSLENVNLEEINKTNKNIQESTSEKLLQKVFTQNEDDSELSISSLFSSTLNFIEREKNTETNKELFNELSLTLFLLQQAALSKQSDNLSIFPQTIIDIANQLQLHTVVKMSQNIINAIQTKEHDLIEKIILDITKELEENKSNFMI